MLRTKVLRTKVLRTVAKPLSNKNSERPSDRRERNLSMLMFLAAGLPSRRRSITLAVRKPEF